jgi:adenine-specific DNA-methyltransferase
MTIDRVTLNDPEARSADPVAENFAALKALFPAAVADGRIDFDVLRQLLGDEVDDGDERYGLNWPGKRRARRLALTPSTGTLRPAREDSVDWDTTRNLMIEGDNLEVLKLLQKSYSGQVKLIYIDPPYNTGKDFVYPDSFSDTLGEYLRLTGQVDDDRQSLSSNSETSGRFHTNWLNMMMPRLLAAKPLLADDGAIFINIDDTEVSNLRLLCDLVFGGENFVANIIWQKKYAVSADEPGIAPMHDTIVVYRKSDLFQRGLLPRTETQNSRYTNPDNDPRGEWASDNYVSNKSKEERPTLWYAIKHPRTGEDVWPEPHAVWRYSPDKHAVLEAEGRLYWGPDQGYRRPRMKRYLSEVQQGLVPSTWWPFQEVGHNDEAQKGLGELLGRKVFSTPKPVRLLDRIIEIGGSVDGIHLDFFAGSGTLGHAVMERNLTDGGCRRYIAVQLPEPLDPDDSDQKTAANFCEEIGKPLTLAEITKERLRRAAAKIRIDHPDTKADLGFRVYKLATSNLRAWEPGEDLAADLLAAADNIVQGRTEDDLLTELLLKQGIDLTEPMLTETVAGAPVHAMGGGVLVVCLAPVTAANAEALADGIADWIMRLNPVAATTVFFKDAGFEDDVAKANVAAILEQRLEDQLLKVRSL